MGFDGKITGSHLRLTGIEEGEILLQDEEVLPPIVPRQGRDDVGLGSAAPVIAVLSQLLRVSLPGNNVAGLREAPGAQARDDSPY